MGVPGLAHVPWRIGEANFLNWPHVTEWFQHLHLRPSFARYVPVKNDSEWDCRNAILRAIITFNRCYFTILRSPPRASIVVNLFGASHLPCLNPTTRSRSLGRFSVPPSVPCRGINHRTKALQKAPRRRSDGHQWPQLNFGKNNWNIVLQLVDPPRAAHLGPGLFLTGRMRRRWTDCGTSEGSYACLHLSEIWRPKYICTCAGPVPISSRVRCQCGAALFHPLSARRNAMEERCAEQNWAHKKSHIMNMKFSALGQIVQWLL